MAKLHSQNFTFFSSFLECVGVKGNDYTYSYNALNPLNVYFAKLKVETNPTLKLATTTDKNLYSNQSHLTILVPQRIPPFCLSYCILMPLYETRKEGLVVHICLELNCIRCLIPFNQSLLSFQILFTILE